MISTRTIARGIWAALAVACLLLPALPVAAQAVPAPVTATAYEDDAPETVVIADPADPYYPLAEEIAAREGAPLRHSLAEASAAAYALWVVSPARLSDQTMVDLGRHLLGDDPGPAMGIITGSTIDLARDLWQRAGQAGAVTAAAVTAANPSAGTEARIARLDGDRWTAKPLTLAELVATLRAADLLTFTGHGGATYLRLDDDTTLRAADLPALSPIVVGTASCNTLRPWEDDSIALAFVDNGAAAYAGFAYSPNEGYLIGEFDGLPFRYTWPEFPIGRVMQVQGRGALQGFAAFPYYHLLGDPRIALQAAPPYTVLQDEADGATRTLVLDAPAGVVPVRVAGGARYAYVEATGITATAEGDPLYNSRLQMLDAGEDKFVLVEHEGGELTLRLHERPPALWTVLDPATDALDHALIYAQRNGGDVIGLLLGTVALLGALWRLRRRPLAARTLWLVGACGLAFAGLHAGYAALRLEHVTITSKAVSFGPLPVLATLVLTVASALIACTTRSWRGLVAAMLVALSPYLAAAAFGLGAMAAINLVLAGPALGTGIYNYAIGAMPLLAAAVAACVYGPALALLRRLARSGAQAPQEPPVPAVARE